MALLNRKTTTVLMFLLLPVMAKAQDSTTIRQYIGALTARNMAGRGYVGRGMQKAAAYIADVFATDSLRSFGNSFVQPFSYPVNTFPGVVNVRVNDKTLQPCSQFLVSPASNGTQVEDKKIKVLDLLSLTAKSKDSTAFVKKLQSKTGKQKYAWYLANSDSVCKLYGWRQRYFATLLPGGTMLLPHKAKAIWSVAREPVAAAIIDLYDTTLQIGKKDLLSATVINQYQPKFKADNVIAYVPGTAMPDSFVVLAAHYDHLGKMGSKAMFPGASDNASGTAMLLALAQWYAQHPAKYSIAFMAFAGEEAGLLGSDYYTNHPLFPLEKIKFLINIDIMGDATDGIAVVNGAQLTGAFNLLKSINDQHQFVPSLTAGGPAANSDHYHFTEKGVPAFFLFSKGGKGYYHDVWDNAESLSLKNIPATAHLIKAFIAALHQL
ncbi:MAG: M28 family peptidase [Edaphocola sp.]